MEILFLKIRAVAKSVSSSFHSKRSQTLSNVISLGVPSKHLTQHILIFLFPGKSGIIHARWCGGARTTTGRDNAAINAVDPERNRDALGVARGAGKSWKQKYEQKWKK